MRRISLVLVALVSIGFTSVALGACGGSSAKSPEATTTPLGDSTTTTISAPLIQDIGRKAWFAGFELTLESALFTPTPSPTVEISTIFENLGTDVARFDGSLTLATGGSSISTTDLTDIPEVPGGTKGKGTIRFSVSPEFDFADAVLTIGASDHNQAIVPLASDDGLVSLEPAAVTVTGNATAGQLQIAAHDGELRADILENHGEVDKGQLALTIDFDATNNGTGGGGYPFVADNLALTLPDGTTVAPDDAPIELLGHRATTKNLSVRFLIDDPAAGDYNLLLREGQTEGKLKFTIKATSVTTTT